VHGQIQRNKARLTGFAYPLTPIGTKTLSLPQLVLFCRLPEHCVLVRSGTGISCTPAWTGSSSGGGSLPEPMGNLCAALIPVSGWLIGTCNVPDSGSAVASPCTETGDAGQWMNTSKRAISGLAETRVFEWSQGIRGQTNGRYRLMSTVFPIKKHVSKHYGFGSSADHFEIKLEEALRESVQCVANR
jgi:hypothetical protein